MFFDRLLDLIFPPRCLSCQKNLGCGVICDDCLSKIKINQTLFCGKCGARLPQPKKICHKNFPYLLGAATNYENEIAKNLIHSLKFQYIKAAAQPLGNLLIQYTEALSLPLKNFIVIPIPLSKKRLRGRGFNQAELIAKIFAEHFELPPETNLLVRTKNAKPQSEIKNLKERLLNVKDCFAVINQESVASKNILLIDDVITSGATLLEATAALKNAGARKIIALAVAKA